MPDGGHGVQVIYIRITFRVIINASLIMHLFQILYKNSTVNDPFILTLPTCTAMCPFDQFVALTSSVVPLDIVFECEVSSSLWTKFPWTSKALLVFTFFKL